MSSNDPETTAPSAVPPSKFDKQRLGSQKQNFLSVHVNKGSSNAQIAVEILKALNSGVVPYFDDKDVGLPPFPHSSPTAHGPARDQGGASQGGAENQDPASQAAERGGGNDPDDRNSGLLILLQQEGRP